MTSVMPRRGTIAELSFGSLLLPSVAVTGLLWWTSTNPVEISAGVFAFLLLLIPWGSYLCWRQVSRSALPIFSMVAGAYWVYFALALFWGQRGLGAATRFATITPSETTVTAAVRMALVGVTCLWVGMRVPLQVWAAKQLPDIVDRPSSWVYVRIVLIVGTALGVRSGSVWLLGEEARQIMTTLVTVVPDVAFVLLLDRYLRGAASSADRFILIGCGIVRVLGGLASGWLGPTVAWGLTCGALLLLRRRTFPWLPIVLTTVSLVFLQVGKDEFRTTYWSGQDTEASIVERVQFWLERSTSLWRDVFTSGDAASALGLASKSLERASLLTQVAHVLEMTPELVPFQQGETYKFLSITLIPRILWPDKPSISDANQFYQVAYGLTAAKDLGNVSIAVGSLAEGYINFGWPGAIGVMLFAGVVLGIYQRTLLSAQSSMLFLAVGLTVIPGFLTIESQLGQYFGGVIQQVVLAVLVFLPVAKRPSAVVGAQAHRVAPVRAFLRRRSPESARRSRPLAWR